MSHDDNFAQALGRVLALAIPDDVTNDEIHAKKTDLSGMRALMAQYFDREPKLGVALVDTVDGGKATIVLLADVVFGESRPPMLPPANSPTAAASVEKLRQSTTRTKGAELPPEFPGDHDWLGGPIGYRDRP